MKPVSVNSCKEDNFVNLENKLFQFFVLQFLKQL